MAAVQPFISGAISKTVNVPREATVDDIKELYIEAWRLGVKCLAIYRDGSKGSQPLSTSSQQDAQGEASERPIRRRLADTRDSRTHKFSVGGHEGYMHVGFFEDGTPGEVFLTMSKQGSTISGLMDSIAILISVALQYGVPLESLVDKFSHVRFEPSGFTQDRDIPMAKSIVDYVFRWLGKEFLQQDIQEDSADVLELDEQMALPEEIHPHAHGNNGESDPWTDRERIITLRHGDAPACHECGTIMIRSGICYRCTNCGATSGCS